MTQADLCRLTGIRTGQISRYVNDTNEPEKDGLDRICNAFPEPTRAKLTVARLLDCVPDSAASLVKISIIDAEKAESTMKEDAPAFGSLPKEVREALDYLSKEARVSKDMRDAIVSWVNVMRS